MTETLEESAPYYCYIVRCCDGTLYTGITNNLERRIAAIGETINWKHRGDSPHWGKR